MVRSAHARRTNGLVRIASAATLLGPSVPPSPRTIEANARTARFKARTDVAAGCDGEAGWSPGSTASGDLRASGSAFGAASTRARMAPHSVSPTKRIVAYHALTLTQELASELERGLSDLPLDRLPGAERCEPGQPVRLVAPAGSPAALAVVDPENQLVRAFARASEGHGGLDASFFRARVRTARTLRAAFGLDRAETTHRLIHAAGDGLPGMTVDVYADYAVLYAYARGLLTLARLLARALLDELGLQGVVIKLRAADSAQGNLKQEVLGSSPPEQFVAQEQGLPLEVHLLAGLNVGYSPTCASIGRGSRVVRAIATCSTCFRTPAVCRSLPREPALAG